MRIEELVKSPHPSKNYSMSIKWFLYHPAVPGTGKYLVPLPPCAENFSKFANSILCVRTLHMFGPINVQEENIVTLIKQSQTKYNMHSRERK